MLFHPWFIIVSLNSCSNFQLNFKDFHLKMISVSISIFHLFINYLLHVYFPVILIYNKSNLNKLTALPFAASEIRTPTTSSESGSEANCSNHPTIASNTTEVDRVHDMHDFDPLPSQPISPLPAEDIPSPDHEYAFSSVDLPLCPSAASATIRYETMNWAQRRLEFRQSSINQSRSMKRSINSHVSDHESRDSVANAFPEKRQSEPHIRYAFNNQGFEMISLSRRFSVNQMEMRRRAMPDINEFSFEEDLDYYQTKQWPVNSLSLNADDIVPVPRFKVRLCGDRNKQLDLDASFESTSSGEYSDSYLEMIDDGDDADFVYDDSDLLDPFVASEKDGGGRDGVNQKKCMKCGHKNLLKQFTNSFT